ncbi:hypothetical protein G52EAM_00601 [Candidatus Nanoperiomorbus periodonticus]|nr:hypothetical protein G52EAM_00675 [Candidatus Nanoperiomorbus periodonticus]RYC75339.1 hypothetical protein G52EAM_00601 [Candidatus Nanoperiomorbus periodonticus]
MDIHVDVVGLAVFHGHRIAIAFIVAATDLKEIRLGTHSGVICNRVKGNIVGRILHGEELPLTRTPGLYCHGDNDGYNQS